ncbi:MAG: hypothetical protein A3K60_00110 [Euryarchaeota archaeon RBG_19FT_COMBO_56_21]|nr:MAG: hypothetical protein A3K60_00110 [Euryarchaeota archaeon RBG_19FT_COMBO_56_21]
MPESDLEAEREAHKRFAVACFNLAWQLIDNKNRTKEESDRMIHAAHASRFHWGEIGKPENMERGDWQISRVYALLRRSEPSLYHAMRCLEICEENNIGDWDIAFAYEAMARANSVAGNEVECERYAGLARDAGEHIREKEDKDLFFSELKTLSCQRPS